MKDDDESVDNRKSKKNLTNSISYTINKKMNLYDTKLDIILKKMEISFENIEKKINKLEERFNNLENTILNLKENNVENEVKLIENKFNYMDIKEESFDLDINFVKSCLNNTNIIDDIKIFKKIYIDNIPKEYYPIRHIGKKYQYWLDGHMNNDDSNGSYIKNIILRNIEKCYLKVNTIENYADEIEQFLKNQDHINKFNEEKYKENFLLKITSLINI